MANVHRMTKKRLGELLLQEGVITQEQLDESIEEQQKTGELIGDILVRRGFATESDVARTISTQFSFPYISVMHYYISPEMVGIFPLESLEKNLFVPIDQFGDVLNIVVAGLLDQDVVEDIEKTSGCTAQVYVGMVSEVKQVIKERFTKQAAKKPAAKGASGVNVDVTAPPTEGPPVSATATADLDPALADLEQALEAADSSFTAQADEGPVAPTNLAPPLTDLEQALEAADSSFTAQADEEDTASESQTAEAEGAEAAEAEDEGEDDQEPKKRGRFRFFESD